MNGKQPSAEAVAIEGDRIVWVGSTNEAKRLYPNPGRSMDLYGATVLPGITDAHTHVSKLADLTVISKDIRKIPPREILSVRVLKTFVGGKAVYEAEATR